VCVCSSHSQLLHLFHSHCRAQWFLGSYLAWPNSFTVVPFQILLLKYQSCNIIWISLQWSSLFLPAICHLANIYGNLTYCSDHTLVKVSKRSTLTRDMKQYIRLEYDSWSNMFVKTVAYHRAQYDGDNGSTSVIKYQWHGFRASRDTCI